MRKLLAETTQSSQGDYDIPSSLQIAKFCPAETTQSSQGDYDISRCTIFISPRAKAETTQSSQGDYDEQLDCTHSERPRRGRNHPILARGLRPRIQRQADIVTDAAETTQSSQGDYDKPYVNLPIMRGKADTNQSLQGDYDRIHGYLFPDDNNLAETTQSSQGEIATKKVRHLITSGAPFLLQCMSKDQEHLSLRASAISSYAIPQLHKACPSLNAWR